MRAKLGIALLIVFTLLAAACGDDADSGDDGGGSGDGEALAGLDVDAVLGLRRHRLRGALG